MASDDQRGHHHHVHLDEADWEAWAAQTELEAEVFLAFVTEAAEWVAELRHPQAPPVGRVIDVGSGPGVGTCELARLFPDAEVIAVDSSTAMLDRTRQRASARGLENRVRTHTAELPDGLDDLGDADVIWASMSLHHVGDEVAALRLLGDLLRPHGLIAIAERADPLRMLPDDLEVGRPGLGDRLEQAGSRWFAGMREGLPDSVPSADLPTMIASAGLDVAGSRVVGHHIGPPLADEARRVALGHLRRTHEQLGDHLDDDDLDALHVLTDADDPRSVMHRPDVFLSSSRQILIARPRPSG